MRGPRLHLFVCTHSREDTGLGPGCGARGEALYARLKSEVARRGLVSDTWVTETRCLGVCPKQGATTVRLPGRPPANVGADAADVAALLDAPLGDVAARSDRGSIDGEELAALLASLETLQTQKVLALARRLKPGLTLEDVKNPHDFPELADPDWHYLDGVLAGIQSVAHALAARSGAAR